MNGGKHKNDEELKLDFNDGLTLKSVLKAACKKFGVNSHSSAKLYNKDGVLLLDSDFGLIQNGDILYIAPRGKTFHLPII